MRCFLRGSLSAVLTGDRLLLLADDKPVAYDYSKGRSPLAKDTAKVFDYPTFNPHFKMSAGYRFFYAIAPATAASRHLGLIGPWARKQAHWPPTGTPNAWQAPGKEAQMTFVSMFPLRDWLSAWHISVMAAQVV